MFPVRFLFRTYWVSLWISLLLGATSHRATIRRAESPRAAGKGSTRRRNPLDGLGAILVGAARRHPKFRERLLRERLVRRRRGRGLIVRGKTVDHIGGRLLVARAGEDRAQQDEDEHEGKAREADADTLHAGRSPPPSAKGI